MSPRREGAHHLVLRSRTAAGRAGRRCARRAKSGSARTWAATRLHARDRTGRRAVGGLAVRLRLLAVVLRVLAGDRRADDEHLPALRDLLGRALPDAALPARPVGERARRSSRCPAVPRGAAAMVDTSRSPNTVIATVRGMGVAVSTSTCGGVPPFARSASRCSTPNRCCSSTTTRPRSKNVTASPSRACVPTTIRAWPETVRSRARLRSAAGQLTGEQGRHELRPRDRDRASPRSSAGAATASTSVGASSADCPPESATASIARSATSVLPEPTSPCTSRCIGAVAARSRCDLAADHLLVAGQRERQRRVEALEQAARHGPAWGGRDLPRAPPAAAAAPPAARTPPGSAARRARAATAQSFCGRWMPSSASRNGSSPRSATTASGTGSGTGAERVERERRPPSAPASSRPCRWPGRSGSASAPTPSPQRCPGSRRSRASGSNSS